jgi:AmiR/NasT family two-component response regulator
MTTLETGRDPLEECEEELGNVREKLETLPTIEQAKGILIGREGYSDDEAFDVLRSASMRQNRKLRDIAADLIRNTRERARNRGQRPPG